MTKYIIGEVLDVDTSKKSKEFGYRVGRECEIDDRDIAFVKNSHLVVYYPNHTHFITSEVVEFDETDGGFWITTKNRKYRFDRV